MAIEAAVFARPYAKALFEWAEEHGQLSEMAVQLDNAAVIAENADVVSYLGDPRPTKEEKLAVFTSLKEGVFSEVFAHFLSLLVNFDRLLLLPEIKSIYGALKSESEQRVQVCVVSAKPFDEAAKQRFETALSQKLDKAVSLVCETNPELLGGAIVKSGDWVIDGSVKGRLTKLAENLV